MLRHHVVGRTRQQDTRPSLTIVRTIRILALEDSRDPLELACSCPMLAALAGRLTAAGQDHEDAEAMVVAACWASLVEPSTDRPRTPESVMSTTWSRLRTETRRDARLRWVLEVGVPVPDDCDLRTDPALGVSTLLADARRRRVVSPTQAELVTATRVRDRPVEEVAASTGLSRPALWKARRRAELALAEFVAGTEREAER